VRARIVGEHVEVSVEDRGMGIAAADHTRIFDPFYRAPEVVAAQIQGAGLGLSLVKRIVDGHHGRIVVTSTPGAGSTFVVTLPIAAGTPAEAASGVGATAAQPS
jgi:signal transduction histidine kinase